MSKVKEIVTVIFVIVVFVGFALILGFNGVKNGDYSYVMLEVNPRVEFLADKHNNVVSVYAINDEARQLLAGEQFDGMDIEDAVTKFVDLCVQANYIDVESNDNAVKLTTVSGFMQVLDVNVCKEIRSYFKDNQIKSVIVENQNDLEQYKKAKKQSVNVKKYSLIEAVCRFEPNLTFDKAEKLTEKELLDRINVAHKNLKQEMTIEDLATKTKLIDFNRAKLNKHKDSITNDSLSKFADEYKDNEREKLGDYEKEYKVKSEEWEENRLNRYYA